MTEGNRTVTLHTNSLERLMELADRETLETENPTPATIARTIEAQTDLTSPLSASEPEGDTDETFAVAFCGLPGAGKTTAAEIAADLMGGTAVSMGDAIRNEFVKETYGQSMQEMQDEGKTGVAIDSVALADFAAEARAEDARQIPQWVLTYVEEREADMVAIDGVRSLTDYHVLNDYFDTFLLVYLETSFWDRYERVTSRGREGEDEFNAADLMERDYHELNHLGVADLLGIDRHPDVVRSPDPEMQIEGIHNPNGYNMRMSIEMLLGEREVLLDPPDQ